MSRDKTQNNKEGRESSLKSESASHHASVEVAIIKTLPVDTCTLTQVCTMFQPPVCFVIISRPTLLPWKPCDTFRLHVRAAILCDIVVLLFT